MSEFHPHAQPTNPSPAQAPMTPPASQWSGPPRVNPNRGLAIAALSLAGVALLLTFAMAAASFSAAREFEAAHARGGTSADVFTAYDVLTLPWLVSLIVAWVLTALWLGKARKNVANIRPGFHFRRSPVWDWLGWFIPIVSFWFPLQIVGDLSKGSSPSMKAYRWVGAWWAAWVVGIVASQAVDRVVLSDGGESIGILPAVVIVHAIAWAVAYALWVRIVMSIVGDQEYATSAS